jgi:formyl-CoA transferase
MMARAEAGWFVTVDPARPPIPGGISADYPAGLMLMQGILIALLARAHSGRGQLVTTDLFSVAFHANSWEGANDLNADRIDEPARVGGTEAAIDKAFRTRDGFIEVSPVFSTNALRDISVALGLGDLSQEPHFTTQALQIANRRELNSLLAARFAEKTTDQWIAELEPQGVLCARINTFAEAAADPQLLANGMVVEMEHATAGPLRLLGTPVRLHATPPSLRLPPADLGEHTGQVLAELGYSAAEIEGFKASGVLG